MSSFIYYKIPFEGKIEALYELIKNRDWNISLKIPENGIIYMKVPEDADDEVIFNQDLVFDETTNSKFGIFEKITESDYEAANNIEIHRSTEKKTIRKQTHFLRRILFRFCSLLSFIAELYQKKSSYRYHYSLFPIL